MAKQRVINYTFDKTAKTVTFTDYTSITLDSVLLIVNATTQTIIYNFADSALGGTVATNVLTLEYDTTAMANTDKLVIFYDDGETDYDSGGGKVFRPVTGVVVPGSGGPVAITGDASNGLDVDVTRVTGTVTVDSELPAAAALADATANPTVPTVGADNLLYNGTTWDRMRGDTTNGLDVDVTRVVPDVTATALGKAEDAAHSSGDTGVLSLFVRKDTAASTAGTDGDYAAPILDSTGRQWVHVGAIDAGTAVIGTVGSIVSDSAAPATGLTPLFATISVSATGDNSIVAADASKKIRVLSYVLTASGATNAKWRKATTDISGLLYMGPTGGVSAAYCPTGHFETGTNQALQLNLSNSTAVGGHIVYVLV